jgi:hypothetical protein
VLCFSMRSLSCVPTMRKTAPRPLPVPECRRRYPRLYCVHADKLGSFWRHAECDKQPASVLSPQITPQNQLSLFCCTAPQPISLMEQLLPPRSCILHMGPWHSIDNILHGCSSRTPNFNFDLF